MTRVLGTILILLALIAAIGFYRGWFYAQSSNDNNQSTVNVTVDKDKIRQDESEAQNKAQQLKEDISSSSQAPATQPTTP